MKRTPEIQRDIEENQGRMHFACQKLSELFGHERKFFLVVMERAENPDGSGNIGTKTVMGSNIGDEQGIKFAMLHALDCMGAKEGEGDTVLAETITLGGNTLN